MVFKSFRDTIQLDKGASIIIERREVGIWLPVMFKWKGLKDALLINTSIYSYSIENLSVYLIYVKGNIYLC